MSMPNIPNITPEIKLGRKDSLNLLLTSIALEEIALSHVLNAEAEKLQFVLRQKASLKDILKINKSFERVLRSVIKKEMLLQFKLENVMELEEESEFEECPEE